MSELVPPEYGGVWRRRTATACSSISPVCSVLPAALCALSACRVSSGLRRSEDRQELDGDPNKNKGGHYEDKFALTLNFRKCVKARPRIAHSLSISYR